MTLVIIILNLMVVGVSNDHVWGQDALGNTYWCANTDGVDDMDLEVTRSFYRDECFRCSDDIALCQRFAPHWINEIEHGSFVMGWTGEGYKVCELTEAPSDDCGNVEVTLHRLVNSDYYRPHLDALVALWTAESKLDETTDEDKIELTTMVNYVNNSR